MSKGRDKPAPIPPIGVKVTTDLEHRNSGIRARARWTDPVTKKRETRAQVVPDEDAAEEFFQRLQRSAELGVDLNTTMADYIKRIGTRWERGLDPTSTVDGYRVSVRLRVIPAFGHLPIASLTPGMIDRTIDEWEKNYSTSSIKTSTASLARILDEAVRDEIIRENPARMRAPRSLGKSALNITFTDDETSPRRFALRDLKALNTLADECGKVHQCYSDFVMLCALLSARGSEVAGLRVRDVDLEHNIVKIRIQTYPGVGGLVDKQTKGRETRIVPILKPLVPILKRLTEGRDPDERLLTGPRGGVLTTASVRRATKWDNIVTRLGYKDLTRHGLRHTGATWMADAGIPLHVLQKILGHKSIDTTRGYLHPITGTSAGPESRPTRGSTRKPRRWKPSARPADKARKPRGSGADVSSYGASGPGLVPAGRNRPSVQAASQARGTWSRGGREGAQIRRSPGQKLALTRAFGRDDRI